MTEEKPKPRMAIIIEDGIVQSVHADHDVYVLVVDYDDDSDEPAIYANPTVERNSEVIDELAKETQAFMESRARQICEICLAEQAATVRPG